MAPHSRIQYTLPELLVLRSSAIEPSQPLPQPTVNRNCTQPATSKSPTPHDTTIPEESPMPNKPTLSTAPKTSTTTTIPALYAVVTQALSFSNGQIAALISLVRPTNPATPEDQKLLLAIRLVEGQKSKTTKIIETTFTELVEKLDSQDAEIDVLRWEVENQDLIKGVGSDGKKKREAMRFTNVENIGLRKQLDEMKLKMGTLEKELADSKDKKAKMAAEVTKAKVQGKEMVPLKLKVAKLERNLKEAKDKELKRVKDEVKVKAQEKTKAKDSKVMRKEEVEDLRQMKEAVVFLAKNCKGKGSGTESELERLRKIRDSVVYLAGKMGKW